MASTIESFLKLKKKQYKTKTVTVSICGEKYDFDIKELDPAILSEIQVAHTVAIPSSVQGGPPMEGANPLKLSLDVCLEAIVAPDLHDARLQDHFGVLNDRDLLYEIFKNDLDALGVLFEEVINFVSKDEPQTRGTSPDDVEEAKKS